MRNFSYTDLFEFSCKIFLAIGCSKQNAAQAATVLLSADLRGIDSHGIARLSGYVRLCEVNRINANPNIKILHETASTAVVDGDAGLGLIVAPIAMQIAMEKANKVGTGWVSVQNSNHFGIAGYHAMLALPQEMIGIAMTNASALVAPTYSRERLLGTNPIAVAVPAGSEPPFVADFATTTAANGKLEILQRLNKPAPEGWVQTKDGSSSTNAGELKNGGALLPLGGDKEHGSHKGYMLGSIVDFFSGILSGANFGPWVPPFPAYLPMPENMPGKGIGHFLGAMRIDAFRPAEDFKMDMDSWIKRVKKAKTIKGKERIVIPGEPEAEMEKYRKINGFNLDAQVIADLAQLAAKFSIPF
ncbi:MAG TPA: Ldh family oxidoreductase [Ferruginibacter sp.]|nr:Ldh family oxidoreductase [Ferruginibacter sp.]